MRFRLSYRWRCDASRACGYFPWRDFTHANLIIVIKMFNSYVGLYVPKTSFKLFCCNKTMHEVDSPPRCYVNKLARLLPARLA